MTPRQTALGVAVALLLVVGGMALLLPRLFRPQQQTAPPVSPPASQTPIVPGAAAPREGARVGSLAPDFVLRSVTDRRKEIRLSDFRGQVVVVNFWASWCAPCRQEVKDFEQAYGRYRSRGLVVLGVDIVQDTWDDAAAFVKEFNLSYPTVRDDTGGVTQRYQIVGLPTTYFIDRQGIIRDRFVGGFLGELGRKELVKRIEAQF